MNDSTDELDEIYIYSGTVWLIRMNGMPSETVGDVVSSLCIGRRKSTGNPLVPMFTNSELAEKFVKQIGIPNISPFKFTDSRQLLLVLEAMPKSGINDIAIDMDMEDAIYWPVTRLIDRVKKHLT